MKFTLQKFNPFLSRMFFLLSVLLLVGCQSDRLKVDVSDVKVDVRTSRLDQDLFHASERDFKKLNSKLATTYGEFYQYYLEDIIAIGSPEDPMIEVHLERFATDANWQEVQSQIDKVFAEMESYNKEIESAFQYHRFYFPEDEIPEIVYYNSGFNVGVYPAENYLGIGLEWFLGPESPVIQRLAPESFPQYFKDKLRPAYLVNNAIKGWLMVKHQNLLGKEDLLNLMIFHGKIMYMLDALFPEVNDEIKINYTTEELEWCRANEYNMWAHLVDADVLYSANRKDLAGFINDGPFTPAFQQGSPARTGMWMGWQIMRQYMDKNPGVSLQQMLREDNPQKILKYYKP